MKFLARLQRDDKGATAIEYGLIAALIAVGIIIAATNLGTELSSIFQRIADKLQNTTVS